MHKQVSQKPMPSLIDSCLLLYFPAFVKELGTGKFILHPKAAVNPLTAYQVIQLVWTLILTIKHHTL